MSDTPKSASGSKESTSKSDTAKSDTAKPSTAKSSDSASSSSASGEAGKSSRESVGGAGAVHYGFFSNVKSPQYRSGWDDIWAKKPNTKKNKPTRARGPVMIELAIDDLPDEVRNGLIDAARSQLKKSRINYDNRTQSGSVNWRIECEIKR